jgi:hypothetical protein
MGSKQSIYINEIQIMEAPVWLDRTKVKITLDARPLLATGNHPLETVICQASSLNSGEIYEILTPFPPSPMIDKMKILGFESFSMPDATGLFHTFFLKG